MKFPAYCAIMLVFFVVLNIFAILFGETWLVTASRIGFFLPLLFCIRSKKHFYNLNFAAFLLFILLGEFTHIFRSAWYFNISSLLFIMASYIFLSREALQYTRRKEASRYMLVYFLFLVVINSWLMGLHLFELETYISSSLVYGLYILYYINLMLLGLVGLIYYLNSYSRKSVFFISGALAMIFADIFRDMGQFYMQDTSVWLIENLLRFAMISFAFLFFITREKELRLLNML